MPINKRIDQLEDGETCLVEKVIREVQEPKPGKKAWRVWFMDDHTRYYSQRSVNLLKPGDRVSVTIKASEYNDQLYYWIEDFDKVQKEELPLATSLIDLKPFCSTDETRIVALGRPWLSNDGKEIIACDGRILVRIPNDGSAKPNEHAPKWEGVWVWPEKADEDFTPIGNFKIPEPNQRDCEYCDGEGITGEGKFSMDCEECDGEGVIESIQKVRVGKRWLADHLLRNMAKLPNCELAVEFGDDLSPVCFRFTGGRGVVMPMRIPKEEE